MVKTLDDFHVISSEGPLCTKDDILRQLVVEVPDGRRFRLGIRRNFYSFQSSATVEVWREGQWVNVVRRFAETVSTAVGYVTHIKAPNWPTVYDQIDAFTLAILEEAMVVTS